MPWNVIIPLIIIAGIITAIVIIKRKQDAPLRSFIEAINNAKVALRDKPDSIHFTSLDGSATSVPYNPEKQPPAYGEFKLVCDDVEVLYKHERTTEFMDLSSDGVTHVGVQFITDNPTEIYLDGERIMDSRRFLEDYTGEIMMVRRSIRKHLRLQKPDKDKV